MTHREPSLGPLVLLLGGLVAPLGGGRGGGAGGGGADELPAHVEAEHVQPEEPDLINVLMMVDLGFIKLSHQVEVVDGGGDEDADGVGLGVVQAGLEQQVAGEQRHGQG